MNHDEPRPTGLSSAAAHFYAKTCWLFSQDQSLPFIAHSGSMAADTFGKAAVSLRHSMEPKSLP